MELQLIIRSASDGKVSSWHKSQQQDCTSRYAADFCISGNW